MKKVRLLPLAVAALLVVAVIGGLSITERPPTCSASSSNAAVMRRSDLQSIKFGAVRKYKLPGERAPNAITFAPDGSVWFGEQALPGVGHLYPNGTLIEYKWPFQYKSPPLGFTFIWGIAVWDGCVWASDQAGSQIVAVDPNTGAIRTIGVAEGSFPYTMTVGPDDSVWFTEVFASKLARIDDQFDLHEYTLPVLGTPGQIVFANDSLGYYVDTGNVGIAEPGIYSFDPNNFAPVLIDSSTNQLIAPTSLALANNGVWVAQHASSELAYYRFGSHAVVRFPTTPVPYTKTTLPYFVAANGSLVWFNEHYGNRIAVMDTQRGLLTEYSVSDPAANKTSQIDNVLTFALGGSRVWFTELTANYVGYVDATYKPSFSFEPINSTVDLSRGQSTRVTLTLQGQSENNITVIPSDSETLFGEPQSISLNLTATKIDGLHGSINLAVSISADDSIKPGQYELLFTAAAELENQGVYLSLTVLN